KDHVNRELLSQRRWPDKWGFLASEYRQSLQNGIFYNLPNDFGLGCGVPDVHAAAGGRAAKTQLAVRTQGPHSAWERAEERGPGCEPEEVQRANVSSPEFWDGLGTARAEAVGEKPADNWQTQAQSREHLNFGRTARDAENRPRWTGIETRRAKASEQPDY
ncbi:hypothetical protein OS493_035261, partial [Desmophyllum pertusum]